MSVSKRVLKNTAVAGDMVGRVVHGERWPNDLQLQADALFI